MDMGIMCQYVTKIFAEFHVMLGDLKYNFSLEILEITWKLIAPPGNFCMIDLWLFSCSPVIGKLASQAC